MNVLMNLNSNGIFKSFPSIPLFHPNQFPFHLKMVFPTKLLFFQGIFLLFLLKTFFSFSSEEEEEQCQFGQCTHWKILLVPLLTDKFTQVPLLKAIIRSMLSGCRWYFPDQIGIQMFTKNNSFIPIMDPILLPELDQMLDQFKYNWQEREARGHGQWRISVEMAVRRMNGTEIEDEEEEREAESNSSSSSEEEEGEGEADWGRFIFVITDFEQSQSAPGSEFIAELDRILTQTGIFFRSVRLQFDGNKQTHIIPGGGGQQPPVRQNVQNISSNIVRVAIVEPGTSFDAFAAVRPCPQLNDAEIIREYSYVQHFYYENWFLRNPRGALIGFGLFLCAILCAIGAYFFHFWELARAKRKTAAKQQSQQTQPQTGGGGEKGGGGNQQSAEP